MSAAGPRLRAPGLTLLRASAEFLRHAPPRLLVLTLAGLVAARLYVGGWSPWDLLPVVLVLVLQPAVEWLIHVYVLHAKPLPGLGWRLHAHAARHHTAHHEDPWDLRYVVMPLPAMLIGSGIHAVAWAVVCPTWGSTLTAYVLVTCAALVYEWAHFLFHTSYRPRARWMRRLRRHHVLHHFKNEHYWMGVTRVEGDRWFGTAARAEDVPTSPTCRTLLGNLADQRSFTPSLRRS